MHPLVKQLFAVGSLIMLAGCSVWAPQPRHEQNGRFSVTYLTDEGTRTENGRFSYRETQAAQQLDLLTPLNGVLARIEVTPKEACLSRGTTQESVCRASAEGLMTELLGFSFPLQAAAELFKTGQTPRDDPNWTILIRSHHPDGRNKLIQIRPNDSLNTVRNLSLVLD